jgi:co-chaperonin GroES (HSP10)
VGNPDDSSEEPWKTTSSGDIRYIPTQAEIGDYALFLSKASIEIKVEDQDYLILHQSAILVLIRDDLNSLTK